MSATSPATGSRPRLLGPGLLLGVGLGGFVDGIVLHQILQWHHLLSSTDGDNVGVRTYPVTTVAGLEVNTLWDGLFHVTAWLAVAAGLLLLTRRLASGTGPWSRSALLGAGVAGWGLFNVVEGIINHHLLGIHHVRTDVANVLAWDLGFLAFGLLLLLGGSALYRAGRDRTAAPK